MALLTKAPKGTYDLLPRQTAKWQAVEAVMKDEATLHGFREIRTPVFEHTEVFIKNVGDTTDVVQKEMYTFTDKGEGTLPFEFHAHQASLEDQEYAPCRIVFFDQAA